jgi:hypothetical protein
MKAYVFRYTVYQCLILKVTVKYAKLIQTSKTVRTWGERATESLPADKVLWVKCSESRVSCTAQ